MEDLSSLGEFLRSVRREKNLTLNQVAKGCGLSKQYICDIEHGRRGQKLEAVNIAKLAAYLDVPSSQITSRVPNITDKQRRNYAEYYRSLRSTVRATQAFSMVELLRESLIAARGAIARGDDASKPLQIAEKALESLEKVLSYRPKPKTPTAVLGRPTGPRSELDENFVGLKSRLKTIGS